MHERSLVSVKVEPRLTSRLISALFISPLFHLRDQNLRALMCLAKNGAVEINLKKLFEAFLIIKMKIATQGRTWTSIPDLSYPNHSPLPLHYHTNPSKSRKN